MIEIIDLVKKYGEKTAVDHLDLTIEPGRIYGLLGRNGAGKSTTMNVLTGYIGATSGTVEICGHDIFKDAKKAKQNIGYLPEIPPLYTDMTVYEYLCFCAELKGIKRKEIDETVYDIMVITHIEDQEHRLIRNLSKGYRQRVGVAQALIGYPQIIVLDEPTVGLDPIQILEMRDLITELGKNHTIILSSHILSEIAAVCDYVYIIDNGRLMAEFPITDMDKEGMSREKALEEVFISITGEETLEEMAARIAHEKQMMIYESKAAAVAEERSEEEEEVNDSNN